MAGQSIRRSQSWWPRRVFTGSLRLEAVVQTPSADRSLLLTSLHPSHVPPASPPHQNCPRIPRVRGESVPSALLTCYRNVCSSTHPTPPTEMLEWTLWNVAIFYHRQAQHSVGDPAHEHALRAQKFYKLASANKGGNHDAVVGGAVELEQMLGRWQKKPDKLPISGTAMSFSALLL